MSTIVNKFRGQYDQDNLTHFPGGHLGFHNLDMNRCCEEWDD